MKINRLYIVITIVAMGSFLSSCQEKNEAKADKQVSETVAVTEVAASHVNLAIAIVNSDTLLSQYEFASKLRDELTEQSLKYQNILRQKNAGLMAEMQKLQAEASTLSQFEGQTRQRKLYEKQEKLQLKQDEYSQKLMVLEQQYNRDIDSAINEYLNRYCEDKPYEMVLSNTDLGMIRWYKPALDITDEVLAGLNEEYAAQFEETELAD